MVRERRYSREDADEIRSLYKQGHSKRSLMDRYGLKNSVLSRIVSSDWPEWEMYRSHKEVVVDVIGADKPAKDVSIADIRAAFVLAPELKEVIVADRKFEEYKDIFAGNLRTGVIIRCSKNASPDCRKKEIFCLTTNHRPNPVHAANNFRNKGWLVAGGPRADVCPECRNYRPAPQPKPAELIPAETSMQNASNVTPIAAAKKEEPKTTVTMADISIDDRRIINMELERVYDMVRKGYKDDWSDTKLATHLGCRVDYVAVIRDFGFGPEGDTRALNEAIDGVKKVAAEIREVEKTIRLGIERMEELDTKLNERIASFERLQKQFNEKLDAFNKVAPK